MTFNVSLTTNQLATLRTEISVLMPDMAIEYEAGCLRIISDDMTTAERVAMGALCEIVQPSRDLPTWSELSREQGRKAHQGAKVTKRRRQTGVQTMRATEGA